MIPLYLVMKAGVGISENREGNPCRMNHERKKTLDIRKITPYQ
jgi:hypothetical protein